ncbi:cohesin domain-containing protein [Acetivibrio straminisolvens]|uniref:cohesin domain-containing protein n=1 Tax=Acetivibrio straminisolvens TaxID=253314 RepID=UPI002434F0B6|nr:cohesin domain-containing protein [Acetivibrio straminisolvens]
MYICFLGTIRRYASNYWQCKARPGERIEVPINIKNVPENAVANIDFELQYDAELLEIIDIKPGDLVKSPSESFDYNVLDSEEIIVILYAEATGRGTESIKTDGVLCTIVLEVSKDAKPGTSRIKLVNLGGVADNTLREIYTEVIDGKVEIMEASAPAATPTPGSSETAKPTNAPTQDPGTGSSGTPQSTPKVTDSPKPSTTPNTTEQPVEDIPQSGAVGKHTPFLRGYPGGLFKPENNITRAEAAVIFAKLSGADENSAKNNSSISFKDLKDTHWAAWAIKYVTEEKLFGGYPDGTFMPDKIITRLNLQQLHTNSLKSSERSEKCRMLKSN